MYVCNNLLILLCYFKRYRTILFSAGVYNRITLLGQRLIISRVYDELIFFLAFSLELFFDKIKRILFKFVPIALLYLLFG